MAWETRSRGGRYYTRSKKIAGRVVREYVGTGPIAELSAQMDAMEHQERQQARAAIKAEYDADRMQEAVLIDYYKAIDEVLINTLCAAGYHKHKGQWRHRRGKEEDNRPSEP